MQGQISGPWMFAVKSILGSPSATSFAVMITTASSSRPEPGPGAVASSTSGWVPRTVCPGTPARPPTSSAIVGTRLQGGGLGRRRMAVLLRIRAVEMMSKPKL